MVRGSPAVGAEPSSATGTMTATPPASDVPAPKARRAGIATSAASAPRRRPRRDAARADGGAVMWRPPVRIDRPLEGVIEFLTPVRGRRFPGAAPARSAAGPKDAQRAARRLRRALEAARHRAARVEPQEARHVAVALCPALFNRHEEVRLDRRRLVVRTTDVVAEPQAHALLHEEAVELVIRRERGLVREFEDGIDLSAVWFRARAVLHVLHLLRGRELEAVADPELAGRPVQPIAKDVADDAAADDDGEDREPEERHRAHLWVSTGIRDGGAPGRL